MSGDRGSNFEKKVTEFRGINFKFKVLLKTQGSKTKPRHLKVAGDPRAAANLVFFGHTPILVIFYS